MFLLFAFTGFDCERYGRHGYRTEQPRAGGSPSTQACWGAQTTGSKCPQAPPRTFMRSVLARTKTALIQSAAGSGAAQSGMQDPTQSATRLRTRSTGRTRDRTGRSSVCSTKSATLSRYTCHSAILKEVVGPRLIDLVLMKLRRSRSTGYGRCLARGCN